MFPKKEKLENQEFIDIINNNLLYENYELNKARYSEYISELVLRNIYKTDPHISNKYADETDYRYKYKYMLKEFIIAFLKDYSMSKTEILQLYKELQDCTIYDNDTLTDTFKFNCCKDFDPYKKRAQNLQKYLKYFYKNKNSQLLTELHKTKIDLEKITSNHIFNQVLDSYMYILLFEKPLMDIFVKIQD